MREPEPPPRPVTTACDVLGVKSDFVTRRFLRDDGAMVQQTSHAGVAFERIFVRESAQAV